MSNVDLTILAVGGYLVGVYVAYKMQLSYFLNKYNDYEADSDYVFAVTLSMFSWIAAVATLFTAILLKPGNASYLLPLKSRKDVPITDEVSPVVVWMLTFLMRR